MNEELVEKIEKAGEQKAQEEGLEAAVVKQKVTWLIFSINEKKYAIKSAEVHEILKDLTVYSLPFLPSYVEGLINRRGDPFTVLNPLAVFGDAEAKPPKEPLFLVFNRQDDQLALHISDIHLFYDVEESEVHLMPSGEGGVYLGTIDYDHEDAHEEIPALDCEAFELMLRRDLGNA